MSLAGIGDYLIGVQASEGLDFGIIPPNPFEEGPVDPYGILLDFAKRLADVEDRLEFKVDKGRVASEIVIAKEAVKIQSDMIGLIGAVSFWDWYRDVSGAATGIIDPSQTQIRGGVIRTEKILNWDGDSYINLEAGKNPEDDIFLKALDGVKIYSDGSAFLGKETGAYLEYDADTGAFLIQCAGTSDIEGLIVGNVPTTTGYLINDKGQRGFYGGDLVFVHALQDINEGGWNIGAGDVGWGRPNQSYIYWDQDENRFLIDIKSTANNAGLAIGDFSSFDPITGSGFIHNAKAIRGYADSDLVYVAAIQAINEGGWNIGAGDVGWGRPNQSYIYWDQDENRFLIDIKSTANNAGLAIGDFSSFDPITGSGFIHNAKAIRGYANSDLVYVAAIQAINEGNWNIPAGSWGIGNPSTNKYLYWDGSTGDMTIRGNLNADDITAGTITGRMLRTAVSGQRFEVSVSDNCAYWYNSNGIKKVIIGGGGGGAFVDIAGLLYTDGIWSNGNVTLDGTGSDLRVGGTIKWAGSQSNPFTLYIYQNGWKAYSAYILT